MQHGCLTSEATLDRPGRGRREADLGDQDQTAAAARQDLLETMQIDLGLSRSSDTFEEDRRVVFG